MKRHKRLTFSGSLWRVITLAVLAMEANIINAMPIKGPTPIKHHQGLSLAQTGNEPATQSVATNSVVKAVSDAADV